MSAGGMFEIEAHPLNASFSGKRSATRESLFERPGELSPTPTEATNRDSRLKAENDSRRGQREKPTAYCLLPTATAAHRVPLRPQPR
jgi:hypothetical protein